MKRDRFSWKTSMHKKMQVSQGRVPTTIKIKTTSFQFSGSLVTILLSPSDRIFYVQKKTLLVSRKKNEKISDTISFFSAESAQFCFSISWMSLDRLDWRIGGTEAFGRINTAGDIEKKNVVAAERSLGAPRVFAFTSSTCCSDKALRFGDLWGSCVFIASLCLCMKFRALQDVCNHQQVHIKKKRVQYSKFCVYLLLPFFFISIDSWKY